MNEGVMKNSCSKGSPGAVEKQRTRLNQRQKASVSEIIGGSVLVEQVFSYPGLGQAAVAAGTGSDVPLLMGITLITAAIVFLGNFLANVLYGVVDPRIRKGGLGL